MALLVSERCWKEQGAVAGGKGEERGLGERRRAKAACIREVGKGKRGLSESTGK